MCANGNSDVICTSPVFSRCRRRSGGVGTLLRSRSPSLGGRRIRQRQLLCQERQSLSRQSDYNRSALTALSSACVGAVGNLASDGDQAGKHRVCNAFTAVKSAASGCTVPTRTSMVNVDPLLLHSALPLSRATPAAFVCRIMSRSTANNPSSVRASESTRRGDDATLPADASELTIEEYPSPASLKSVCRKNEDDCRGDRDSDAVLELLSYSSWSSAVSHESEEYDKRSVTACVRQSCVGDGLRDAASSAEADTRDRSGASPSSDAPAAVIGRREIRRRLFGIPASKAGDNTVSCGGDEGLTSVQKPSLCSAVREACNDSLTTECARQQSEFPGNHKRAVSIDECIDGRSKTPYSSPLVREASASAGDVVAATDSGPGAGGDQSSDEVNQQHQWISCLLAPRHHLPVLNDSSCVAAEWISKTLCRTPHKTTQVTTESAAPVSVSKAAPKKTGLCAQLLRVRKRALSDMRIRRHVNESSVAVGQSSHTLGRTDQSATSLPKSSQSANTLANSDQSVTSAVFGDQSEVRLRVVDKRRCADVVLLKACDQLNVYVQIIVRRSVYDRYQVGSTLLIEKPWFWLPGTSGRCHLVLPTAAPRVLSATA